MHTGLSERQEIHAEALPRLVAALPEIYQPIYLHPELTPGASRNCDDRLVLIEDAWKAMSKTLGRAPRVLDLGCAQGYISLRLADLGAPVIGVDHFVENIAVCDALAAEHPELQVKFLAANIERLFEYIDLTQIDMVLGLSVFHHMAKAHGYEAVVQWITTLGSRVAACIFELALAEEPVHWASAQPGDERTYTAGFTFVHELGRLPTHLSDVKRPLVFASNYLTYLDGIVDMYQSTKRSSHDEGVVTCEGTRRYYFNDRNVAKVYSLRDSFPMLNQAEIVNEAAFLGDPPAGFHPVPRLHSYGYGDREAWLVRERLAGDLLFDRLRAKTTFDAKRILRDVLHQLVALEERGLYHNDVKTWNVLLMPDGAATLIDYGSISPYDAAFSWPKDLFSSFWVFVWCVASGSAWSGAEPAPPFASPHHLPQPYARWAHAFWRLPVADWTFRILCDFYETALAAPDEPLVETATDLWQRNIESYIADMNSVVTNICETVNTRIEAG